MGLVWVPFFAVWSPLVGPKTGGEKRRFFPGPPGLLFGLFSGLLFALIGSLGSHWGPNGV